MSKSSITQVKRFDQVIQDKSRLPAGWDVTLIQNDDNLCWLLTHEPTKEAIFVDPVHGDEAALEKSAAELRARGFRVLAVIDTHTHADHITSAPWLAEKTGAPVVMHERAPSRRVHVRISRDVELYSHASPLKLLVTPGHTPDSITPIWGPFVCGADTILYGDTGRDDLPGGDAAAHFDSLQKIKAAAAGEMIFLPGHDAEGRISSWKTQLEVNSGLTQPREIWVPEAAAYRGPAPKLLKESLFENFK
jgi:glyoxylase-like metal-dependent hydrolase (beta-lactamase superfamily II)